MTNKYEVIVGTSSRPVWRDYDNADGAISAWMDYAWLATAVGIGPVHLVMDGLIIRSTDNPQDI